MTSKPLKGGIEPIRLKNFVYVPFSEYAFYYITKWFKIAGFYIYIKIPKTKFYEVTDIWPTLFRSIAF